MNTLLLDSPKTFSDKHPTAQLLSRGECCTFIWNVFTFGEVCSEFPKSDDSTFAVLFLPIYFAIECYGSSIYFPSSKTRTTIFRISFFKKRSNFSTNFPTVPEVTTKEKKKRVSFK